LNIPDEICSEIQGFFSDTKADSLKLAFQPKIPSKVGSATSSQQGHKRKRSSTSKQTPNKKQKDNK
jgi:hypothetical protein